MKDLARALAEALDAVDELSTALPDAWHDAQWPRARDPERPMVSGSKHSSTPGVGDAELLIAYRRSVQRIAQAHRELDELGWVGTWQPTRILGCTAQLDPGEEMDPGPLDRPPRTARLPAPMRDVEPAELTGPVATLAAVLRAVDPATRYTDHQTRHIVALAGQVHSAWMVLHDALDKHMPDDARLYVRRCAELGCHVEVHAHGRCQQHYDERRRAG